MKNRLLSLTAAVLFCLLQAGNVNTAFATQSHSDRFYAYTASGDPATDMARVAYAQNGRRQSDFGYTEAWCADFLCDCAKIVGQGDAIPFYGECHGLYNRIISAGGYEVSAPQTGDVVFYNWDHVGLMIDGSNCTSGNMNTSKVSKVETWYYKEICKGKTIRIVRPNYRGTQGYLDVNGWLDGNELVGNVAGYGTFDVYVNGSLLADDVNDFYKSVPAGSSYRVTDIRPAAGHVFSGALNNSFSGTVTEIRKTAASASGVTRYSATITLDKAPEMLPGMTARAEIAIHGVDNALIIPVEALHQTSASSFVYTSFDPQTGEYGDLREVEAGISNTESVEILSGLAEGEVVYYPAADSNPFARGGSGRRGSAEVRVESRPPAETGGGARP